MSASNVKLPKSTQDYSTGIQSVNQLNDNFVAAFEGASAEHGAQGVPHGGGAPVPPSTEVLGHHSTPKVPRAVVRVSLTTASYSVVVPGPIRAAPVVLGVSRFGLGGYFIGIGELQEFYGEAEVEQTSQSPQRLVLTRSGFGGNGTPVGIIVELYEKASVGGGFDFVDTDFSVHIYGTTS